MKLKIHNTIFSLIEHKKVFELSVSLKGDTKTSSFEKPDNLNLEKTLLIAHFQELCKNFKINIEYFGYEMIIEKLKKCKNNS